LNFVGLKFSIKAFCIKVQNLEQMASVESVDELQKRVARYVDEKLGPILREVNRLDNFLGNETIEHILLEEPLRALRTQGGNAQGAFTQRIKLMEPKRL
jgi:hypothetical protein